MKSINELMNLNGRRALITGANGHIGHQIASTIAEMGGDLILVDLPGSNYDNLLENLSSSFNINVECIDCNLEDKKSREQMVHEILKQDKPLNILCNNAAFVGTSGLKGWAVTFEEQSIETWRRALEVNLTAVFDLSKGLSDKLKECGNASIINIGSIAAHQGGVDNPGYVSSKSGIVGLTKALANDYYSANIRVNSISPGYFKSPMTEKSYKSKKRKKNISSRLIINRWGEAKDLFGLVEYLMSEKASYVTGQDFVIDGGWLAKGL